MTLPGKKCRSSESDIEDLKQAHERLVNFYIKAHEEAANSRLLRPVVDGHLRRRTRRIYDAYLHAAETKFSRKGDQEWLGIKAGVLQNLEITFRSRWAFNNVAEGASVLGIPGVVGLFAATGASTGMLTLLDACLCQLLWLVPLFVSFAIYAIFSNAFFDKRKLFIATNTGTKSGIYGAEDNVFDALEVKKDPERPLDLYGWLLITVVWILAIFVEQAETAERHLVNSAQWKFVVSLALAVAMSGLSYVRYRTRRPS